MAVLKKTTPGKKTASVVKTPPNAGRTKKEVSKNTSPKGGRQTPIEKSRGSLSRPGGKLLKNCEAISDNPNFIAEMTSMRNELRSELKGRNDLIYSLIAQACELGKRIEHDPALWHTFHHELLKSERVPKFERSACRSIQLVLKWMFSGSRDAKDASVYWRAVQNIAHKSRDEIFSELKRKGVRKLADANSKVNSKPNVHSSGRIVGAARKPAGIKFGELWVEEIKGGWSGVPLNSKVSIKAVMEKMGKGFVFRVIDFDRVS